MLESLKEFKAASERVRSGESESEVVELPSGRVRITPDPAGSTGIHIEALDVEPISAERVRDEDQEAAAARVKEVMDAFKAGDLDSAEVPLPSGETMRLERDPSAPGAFTARSTDGSMSVRSVPFDGSAARPAHYPEDLPFLPDCAVALAEMGDGPTRSLTWFNVEDPEGAMASIREQLVESGWDESSESRASTAVGTIRSTGFTKGDRTRMVSLMTAAGHAQLTLIELDKADDS